MSPLSRLRPHGWTAAVLIGGLALTAAATGVTVALHRDTEQHLLQRRTNEAGAVLEAAIAGVQTPVVAAAELATATSGDSEAFAATMGTQLDGGRFVSAVLYRLPSGEPVGAIGEPTLLGGAGAARVDAMLQQAVAAETFAVVDLLDLPGRRLGYAAASSLDGDTYVAYAEQPLPEQRTSQSRPSGAFAGLDYALYLGGDERDESLLYASVAAPPITGRHASSVVGFGDRRLLLVTSAHQTLGGRFSEVLPWFVAGTGMVVSVAAAALTERLVRRREQAERLAVDVSRLYDEQRSRSETLQRSLIPRSLDPPPATTVTGRYWPAHPENEIGGDFYDLFPLGDDRWAITIGDVCGKGIEAAALTGVTRHTIRAAARHLTRPVDVLRWAHEAIAAYSGTTYCTACFGVLTLDPPADGTVRGVLELALGGHPGPLLRRADGSVEHLGEPGTVLGLLEPHLSTTRHDVAPGDTLVFYTDGITDAPGDLAVPPAELVDLVARCGDLGPDAIADAIRDAVDERRPSGSGDDTALLVLQLTGPRSVVPSTGHEAVSDHDDVVVTASGP